MNEQLIADYESGMSYDSLCKKYHHKFTTIKKILKENNIDTTDRDRKKYITDKNISSDIIDSLITDYCSGLSLNKVASIYKLSVQKVRTILKQNNIAIRPVLNKKYYLNENYFDILTHNGAYIIGFFAADGWNKKKDNMLELTLSEKDSDILEAIREEIGLTREIKHFSDNNGFQKASLTFSSKKIKSIFEQYGVTSNKTFSLKSLPNIPKEFLPDYIRGYADGDGCISNKYWSICSVNRSFLEDIINFLYNEFGIDKVNIYEDKRREHTLYSFQYTKKESIKKIYEGIYKTDALKLSRKYNKFTEKYSDIMCHETLLHQ